jgi:Cyclic nucleotide-binding domain
MGHPPVLRLRLVAKPLDHLRARVWRLFSYFRHFANLNQDLVGELNMFEFSFVKTLDFIRLSPYEFQIRFSFLIQPCIKTPGEVIYYEGEVSQGLFLLKKGKVELFSNSLGIVHGLLSGPSYFGSEAFVIKTGRQWSSALSKSYIDLFYVKFDKLNDLFDVF